VGLNVTVGVKAELHYWACSLQVLNYGQSVFEGMKAQRSAKGNVVLFRCGVWGLEG
jgi:hypothetical protein